MQNRTKQGVAVLRRVRDFLAGREVAIAIGALPKHVEALNGVIDRLAGHGVEQDARSRAARAGTQQKAQLIRALRSEYMRPLARSAGSLFPNDPVLQQALNMPRFLDPERLLVTAYAMADRLEEHKERYIAEGFVPDFIDKLRAAADAVKKAVDERAADLGRRSASTAGQLVEYRRGRRMVRLLDTMVAPRLADRPDLLAEWRTLTRFTRVAVSSTPVTPIDGEVVTPPTEAAA